MGDSWDKRKTTRRSDSTLVEQADLVYLGVVPDAAAEGVSDDCGLSVGDRLRLRRGHAYTIGRSALCDVILHCEQLSQVHALVSLLPGMDGSLALVDLQSTNGCWVEGETGPMHKLGPGDEFQLARAHRFRYQPVVPV
jgi:hypothetical protein